MRKMKRLSEKQKKDLECIKWFIPDLLKSVVITEQDERDFLKVSERGIKPLNMSKGLCALLEGKRYRGMNIHELWEESFNALDGSWGGYIDLLEGMPRCVVDFIKREMFKGKDAEVIERCYLITLNAS